MMDLSSTFKGLLVAAVTAMVTTGVVTATIAPGPTNEPGVQDPGQDMQAMIDEYLASMKPADFHEMLKSSVGEWNTETKVWWGGPGTEPLITKGTASRKMVLGGRFLAEQLDSQMAIPDATGEITMMPMQGLGLFGYDNNRNMFVGVWADSTSTQLLTMKGMVDPAGKVFTYYGEMDEPMIGVVGRLVKYVTRIVDEDTHVFSIFDLHAGDDYKVVEVTYTRK